jgi:hypothetical protein
MLRAALRQTYKANPSTCLPHMKDIKYPVWEEEDVYEDVQ